MHVLPSIQSSPSLKNPRRSLPISPTFLPPPTTTPLRLSPLPSPNMQAHHTPSDQRYPDTFTSTAFWAPGGSDSSQPAVTRDADDRHGPPRLRANQLSSFGLTQRDSYPTQTQSDCPGQYPYPSQHYIPTVNYTAPPFDLAEYPVSNDIPLPSLVTCGAFTALSSDRPWKYRLPQRAVFNPDLLHCGPLRLSSLRSHPLSAHHVRTHGVLFCGRPLRSAT